MLDAAAGSGRHVLKRHARGGLREGDGGRENREADDRLAVADRPAGGKRERG